MVPAPRRPNPESRDVSLYIETLLSCDRCSCLSGCFSVDGTQTNARKARKLGERFGWERRGGMDLCPECVKATEWPESLLEETKT